jgi:hypothetical protein
MFMSYTVFMKATLLECVLKSTYTNMEVVRLNLRLLIELLNFVNLRKAFNDTVKNVSRYLVWPT